MCEQGQDVTGIRKFECRLPEEFKEFCRKIKIRAGKHGNKTTSTLTKTFN